MVGEFVLDLGIDGDLDFEVVVGVSAEDAWCGGVFEEDWSGLSDVPLVVALGELV